MEGGITVKNSDSLGEASVLYDGLGGKNPRFVGLNGVAKKRKSARGFPNLKGRSCLHVTLALGGVNAHFDGVVTKVCA
jgi:hypothetical protein